MKIGERTADKSVGIFACGRNLRPGPQRSYFEFVCLDTQELSCLLKKNSTR